MGKKLCSGLGGRVFFQPESDESLAGENQCCRIGKGVIKERGESGPALEGQRGR